MKCKRPLEVVVLETKYEDIRARLALVRRRQFAGFLNFHLDFATLDLAFAALGAKDTAEAIWAEVSFS